MTPSPSPNPEKRKALGRGLEALLPARPAPVPAIAAVAESPSAEPNGQPLEIPVDRIDRNPYQTRTRFDEVQLAELTASVAATGVIQPIVVRPLRDGRYQLITGERRLMASRNAGRPTIPSIVRSASDTQTMEMTIVENLQRADLNPMEQARAYYRLSHDFKMTQEQMAQRTGKERASVANFLRLLRLPEPVQLSVEAGELSFGHARALLALEDPDRINAAAAKVRSLSMSVRQTESFVANLLHPENKPAKPDPSEPPRDPNVRQAEEQLQRALGLKVRIEDKRGRGKVIIEYARLEDFDRVLAALGQSSET